MPIDKIEVIADLQQERADQRVVLEWAINEIGRLKAEILSLKVDLRRANMPCGCGCDSGNTVADDIWISNEVGQINKGIKEGLKELERK